MAKKCWFLRENKNADTTAKSGQLWSLMRRVPPVRAAKAV
jgi:hypothetical protein